jgi:hypothetical protein
VGIVRDDHAAASVVGTSVEEVPGSVVDDDELDEVVVPASLVEVVTGAVVVEEPEEAANGAAT